MKMVKGTIIGLTMAASFAGNATQEQQNMNFSVAVSQGCSITGVADTAFSTIDGNFTSNTDSSSGGVTVLCTSGTPYSIGLGNGQHHNGTSRTMTDGNSNFIAYGVYQNNGYSTAWGDIGSGNEVSGTGNGAHQSSTVYARIPSGQTAVPAGNYSDVVVVTLNF